LRETIGMFKKSNELQRKVSTWGATARRIGAFLQPR